MRLFGVVGLMPLEKTENEIQHVGAGFLDCRLCGTGDLPAYGVKLLVVVEDRQELLVLILGTVQIERGVPVKFSGVVGRRRQLFAGLDVRFGYWQK